MKPVLCVGLMAWAVVAATPASAIDRSAEQEQYCTGDAFRLCASEIPNEERIIACMTRRKKELSAECLAVFDEPETRVARRPAGRAKPRPPTDLAPN